MAKYTSLLPTYLSGKIIKESVGLRRRPYSYIIDIGSKDKKAKGTKKCVINRKLKFEDYESCLKATQLENKINHLGKNKFDVGSHKKGNEEFMKRNVLVLKT